MNKQYKQLSRFTLALTSAALFIVTANSFAHGLGQRIGLKSPEVVRNDLRVMGLQATKVTLVGNKAKVTVRINGKLADVEMNRRTGQVRVVKAAPAVLKLIKQRAPRVILQQPRATVTPVKVPVKPPVRRLQPKKPATPR